MKKVVRLSKRAEGSDLQLQSSSTLLGLRQETSLGPVTLAAEGVHTDSPGSTFAQGQGNMLSVSKAMSSQFLRGNSSATLLEEEAQLLC